MSDLEAAGKSFAFFFFPFSFTLEQSVMVAGPSSHQMQIFFSTQAKAPRFEAEEAGEDGKGHSWDSTALVGSLPLIAALGPTLWKVP